MNEATGSPGAALRPGTVAAWDVPTRLFKWALVLLVLLAWVSHRYGDVTLTWHKWNGYAILVLLVFRLLWGLVGSSTARFAAWVPSPGRSLRYGLDLLRRNQRRPYLSHNPLGALMILALLLLLSGEAVSGLFTVDSNGIFGGPFAQLDPMEDPTPLQRRLSAFHHGAFNYLLALVGIHVAVNLTYQFIKRDPVVQAMITGRKPVEDFADQPEMVRPATLWLRAALCFGGAAAIVLGGLRYFGGSLS
ncbi:MAG TPA: cytochrome b/b6 domain-containing protein [Enterovirga sp.]|nr:cytochrome b/b6 domain-containing protein [Enterovirga sp.]